MWGNQLKENRKSGLEREFPLHHPSFISNFARHFIEDHADILQVHVTKHLENTSIYLDIFVIFTMVLATAESKHNMNNYEELICMYNLHNERAK